MPQNDTNKKAPEQEQDFTKELEERYTEIHNMNYVQQFLRRRELISESKDIIKGFEKEIKAIKRAIKNEEYEMRAHENRATKAGRDYDLSAQEQSKAAFWNEKIKADKAEVSRIEEQIKKVSKNLDIMQGLAKGERDAYVKKAEMEKGRDGSLRKKIADLWKNSFIYRAISALRDRIEGRGISLETAENVLVNVDKENRMAAVEARMPDDRMQEVVEELTADRERDEEVLTVPQQFMHMADLCEKNGRTVLTSIEDKETGESNMVIAFSKNPKEPNEIIVRDAETGDVVTSLKTLAAGEKLPEDKTIRSVDIGDTTFYGTADQFGALASLTQGKFLASPTQDDVDKYAALMQEEMKTAEESHSAYEAAMENASPAARADSKDTARGPKSDDKDKSQKEQEQAPKETEVGEEAREPEFPSDKEQEEKDEAEPEEHEELTEEEMREEPSEEQIKEEQEEEHIQEEPKIAMPQMAEAQKEEHGLTVIEIKGEQPIEIHHGINAGPEVLRAAQEAFPEARITQTQTDREGKYTLDEKTTPIEALSGITLSTRDKAREVIRQAAPKTKMNGRDFKNTEELHGAILAEIVKKSDKSRTDIKQNQCLEAFVRISGEYLQAKQKNKGRDDDELRGEYMTRVVKIASTNKYLGYIVKEASQNVLKEQKDYDNRQILKNFPEKKNMTPEHVANAMPHVLSIIENNRTQQAIDGQVRTQSRTGVDMNCSVYDLVVLANRISVTDDGRLYDRKSGTGLTLTTPDGKEEPWTVDVVTEEARMQELSKAEFSQGRANELEEQENEYEQDKDYDEEIMMGDSEVEQTDDEYDYH